MLSDISRPSRVPTAYRVECLAFQQHESRCWPPVGAKSGAVYSQPEAPAPNPFPAPAASNQASTDGQFESITGQLDKPIAANDQTTVGAPQFLPEGQVHMNDQTNGADWGLLVVIDSHQTSAPMASMSTPPQPSDQPAR
ncbi:hypothetical protein FRC08_018639 [Ceratobasidium sp. 394]|nr:hypothetical protein FRC08_018639 [Ceratobasidium sp. 394]